MTDSMTTLEIVNTILLIAMTINSVYWRHKYLQYKRYVMTAMYGGKSDIMRACAKASGHRTVDFKIQTRTGRF